MKQIALFKNQKLVFKKSKENGYSSSKLTFLIKGHRFQKTLSYFFCKTVSGGEKCGQKYTKHVVARGGGRGTSKNR